MNPELKKVNDALKNFLSSAKEKTASQDRAAFVGEVSRNVMDIFAPVLQKLADGSKINKEELASVIREIQVAAPEVKIPEIKIPAPIVNVPAPIVNIPRQTPPSITVSPTPVTFPSEMSLKPNAKPFPVIMMDQGGKPVTFSSGGATGGRADFFAIRDIQTSSGASIIDQVDGTMKVSGNFTVSASNSSTQAIDASATPYSQANPFPVVVVSGGSATTASAIVDSSGIQYSGSNPVPIAIISGSSSGATGQGDAAGATRVVIAGNSDASVVINSGTLTTVTTLTSITNSIQVVALDRDGNPQTQPAIAQGDAATATRVIIAGNSDASVVVNSGTITTVTTLTGITNSIQVVALDRDGNPLTTGPIAQGDAATALRVVLAGNESSSVVVNSGTLTTVTTLTSITNSVATAMTDSTGVQYSGSNPVPVTLANTGSAQNVTVTGSTDSMLIYMARTTLPTAVSDGADVRPSADKLGRTLMRPVNARNLITTAYITLSTGTETTLLAGVAGNYLDLIQVVAANTSSVAAQVDFRAITAGNIVLSLYIPPNATAGAVLTTPWPQDETGNNWTADMGDFTNSNILISALFSKES